MAKGNAAAKAIANALQIAKATLIIQIILLILMAGGSRQHSVATICQNTPSAGPVAKCGCLSQTQHLATAAGGGGV